MSSIVSPEGLRRDGRKWNELRKVSCRLGGLNGCDGSSVYQQGNTHVIASVYGPRECKRSKAKSDRAVISCEYNMAAFSTQDRKAPSKRDRRSMEISLILEKVFEKVIQTTKYPRSEINICVSVLAADGGTRCASINAITLALMDAGIPMVDMVVACAAGKVGDNMLLDLNFREDSNGVDLPVAILSSSNKVVLCQMDSKLPIGEFRGLLSLAMDGASQINLIIKKTIQSQANLLLANASVAQEKRDLGMDTANEEMYY